MKLSDQGRDENRRLMYVESKLGDLDGTAARIGWVSFSRSGRTLHYRGLKLQTAKGAGLRGRYLDIETGREYWVSGVKKQGDNSRWAAEVTVMIDPDARDEYWRIVGR